MFLRKNNYYFQVGLTKLAFVMEKWCDFFEARIEFLNII
jgi:hypothetical protein